MFIFMILYELFFGAGTSEATKTEDAWYSDLSSK